MSHGRAHSLKLSLHARLTPLGTHVLPHPPPPPPLAPVVVVVVAKMPLLLYGNKTIQWIRARIAAFVSPSSHADITVVSVVVLYVPNVHHSLLYYHIFQRRRCFEFANPATKPQRFPERMTSKASSHQQSSSPWYSAPHARALMTMLSCSWTMILILPSFAMSVLLIW